MNQDDIPQPDPQLTFILREGFALSGRIVMQAQFNSESDQASNKAPKGPSLSLLRWVSQCSTG